MRALFLLGSSTSGGRVRVIKRVAFLAGLVRVVREGDVGARRVDAESPALDLGHVLHQARLGQAGRGDRPLLQLAGSQAGALIRSYGASE